MSARPLLKEMSALDGLLAQARSDLEAGGLADLSAVEARVTALCDALAGLSAAEGQALRPRLLALIDELGHLGRAIETRLERIKAELGDAAGRQRAHSAYGKLPGPGR